MGQTRYDAIVELGEDFIKLIRLGLMPASLLGWRQIYEYYLEECKTQKSKASVIKTANEFGLKQRQVYTIIQKMNSY
jgi:hypothetical protein